MGSALNQAKFLSLVMDNFFAREELPETVRLIERDARYDALVWIAWYLYHTGELDLMAQYLRKAWAYSVASPIATLVFWADGFAQCGKRWGSSLDADSLAKLPQWRELVRFLLSSQQGVE
jgi:hypothetical protein